MTTHGKRAETIEDAAFVHTAVFTEPVWSWPPELAERVPSFDDLFVDNRPTEDLGDPLRIMRDRLSRTPGPVKLLMTGQKGSGKSWALKKLGEFLSEKFTVVTVSATDAAGATLPDADVQDLLMLMAAELAEACWPGEVRMRQGVEVDEETGQKLARWVELLAKAGLPDAPGRLEGGSVDLTAWILKTSARLRSDEGIREKLRQVPADDVAEVARALLKVLRGRGREVVVLFDDIDKLDLASARKVFLSQSTALSTLNCRMVLTYPFSLNLDGVARQSLGMHTPVTLRNVKLAAPNSTKLPPEAASYFRALLEKVMTRGLVTDDAFERAVRLSAGVPREFGILLQRACLHAYYGGGTRVDRAALDVAERELRIDMLRATQTAAVRASLCSIRRNKKLATDEERRLLDLNLLVEYVNGEPRYDVHPILAPAVDEWLTAQA